MKKVLLIIISFFSFMTIAFADTEKKNAEFVRCVDGDTAVLKVDDEEVKFRFLAIDTPETVHPTKEVEEFGKDASEYSCNKLTNAEYIVVEYELKNKVDKYGRSLAWIWVDGNLLQKELVEAGYAEVAYIYGKYKYTESLCVVQKRAIEKQNGIWAEGRKEGYCATLDLTNAKDTILEDYDLNTTTKKTTTKKTEEQKEKEDLEKIENKIDDINDVLEDLNEKDYSNYILYVIIGIAIISLLRGSKSKK